jgi:ketosteroid isomerase-like protein
LVIGAVISIWLAIRATVAERSAVVALDAEAAARYKAEQQTVFANQQTTIANQRADELAWEDYVNRVNRAYREVLEDNVAVVAGQVQGLVGLHNAVVQPSKRSSSHRAPPSRYSLV